MYLIYFANTYHHFRLPELDSLLALFGYDHLTIYDKLELIVIFDLSRSLHLVDSPFLVVDFPDDECARKVEILCFHLMS